MNRLHSHGMSGLLHLWIIIKMIVVCDKFCLALKGLTLNLLGKVKSMPLGQNHWWSVWLVFYVPFNIIVVISRRWNGDDERLCAGERSIFMRWTPPLAGFEPGTPLSEISRASRSITWMLLIKSLLQKVLLSWLYCWPFSHHFWNIKLRCSHFKISTFQFRSDVQGVRIFEIVTVVQRKQRVFWRMRTSNTQISLRMRAVWSVPSMSANRYYRKYPYETLRVLV